MIRINKIEEDDKNILVNGLNKPAIFAAESVGENVRIISTVSQIESIISKGVHYSEVIINDEACESANDAVRKLNTFIGSFKTGSGGSISPEGAVRDRYVFASEGERNAYFEDGEHTPELRTGLLVITGGVLQRYDGDYWNDIAEKEAFNNDFTTDVDFVISEDGNTVTAEQFYKNPATGETKQIDRVIPLADATHAGLMSKEQVQGAADSTNAVSNLNNKDVAIYDNGEFKYVTLKDLDKDYHGLAADTYVDQKILEAQQRSFEFQG
ncbi:MAG: hypothetical protein LBK94_00710, partial [Prevotellaceae bacterium]|nr:hypothetical protein [Prevotellaceae bacterium]